MHAEYQSCNVRKGLKIELTKSVALRISSNSNIYQYFKIISNLKASFD